MRSRRAAIVSSFDSGRAWSVVVSRKFLFKFLVSTLILVALFWFLPVDRILGSVGKISIWIWPFMLLAFLSGHALTACKWRMLLAINRVQVSWPLLLRAHGMGLFANICLPSIVGGDVVRASMVVVNTKQLTEVAISSLADRLLDTLALVSLSLGALWALSRASDWTGLGSSSILQYVLLIVGVSIILIVSIFYTIQLASFRLLLPEKVQMAITQVVSTVKLMAARPILTASVFVVSIIVQGSFIVLNVILARSIGIDIDAVVWFYAWPLAKLCALVPISLAGIGVRDAALVGILLPFTTDSAAVVAQSLSWQAVMIAGGLISGFAVYLTKTRFKN